MRQLFVVLVACMLAPAFWETAHAKKRVALVIGNNNYKALPPLLKAVNDAKSVAKTLREIGFDVITAENLTLRQTNAKLRKLDGAIAPGDEVFFFFSGHGVALGGENYLIPSDMPKPATGEQGIVRDEGLAVSDIIRRIQHQGAIATFIVLDACRDNPFEATGTKNIGYSKGLDRVDAPTGVFVLFAAGLRQKALDRLSNADDNPNSVFTRKLLPLLKETGLSHVRLAKKVQRQVSELAMTISHRQEPAYYDQIIGDVYLRPGKKTVTEAKPAAPNDQVSKLQQRLKALEEQLKKRQQAAVSPPPKPNLEKPVKPAVGVYLLEPEMVRIPGGTFRMGCVSDDACEHWEKPVRSVTLKAFEVGKYEVTFAEWDACVDDGGCKYKPEDEGWGRGKRPVISISWNDITTQYIPWLNRKTGKSYRLPTEAEWEYAARGKTETPFWFGTTITTDKANYNGNFTFNGPKGRYRKKTVVVDSFQPNAFGLFNVHGNVWELTQDCWHENYESAPTDGSAWLQANGGDCSSRVVRGGSWINYPLLLRSANRSRFYSVCRYSTCGFRLARTLNPPNANQINTPKPSSPGDQVSKQQKRRKALEEQLKKRQQAAVSPPPKPKVEKPVKPAVGVYPPKAKPKRLPFEPEMVRIPGGTFRMGCVSGKDCLDKEKPVHSVAFKAFEMGKYEVTFAEWDACVKERGCKHKPKDKGWGRGKRPVINVSWDDITKQYIPWLNRKTGKTYRLPTESEWEYAARAGTTTVYSWGNSIECNQASFGNSIITNVCKSVNPGKTKTVGTFSANSFGLHDMHGNVWEWTEDCWHKNYKGAPTDGSAWLKVNGGDCNFRVLRGGSWYDSPRNLRFAGRDGYLQDYRSYDVGFRLSRTLE